MIHITSEPLDPQQVTDLVRKASKYQMANKNQKTRKKKSLFK